MLQSRHLLQSKPCNESQFAFKFAVGEKIDILRRQLNDLRIVEVINVTAVTFVLGFSWNQSEKKVDPQFIFCEKGHGFAV
jgi:hypothetical protein